MCCIPFFPSGFLKEGKFSAFFRFENILRVNVIFTEKFKAFSFCNIQLRRFSVRTPYGARR
eukprot:UN19136